MKKRFLFLLFVTIAIQLPAQLSVNNLLCENRINPQGLDILQPRLSWQLQSANRSVLQTAYEIIVSTAAKANKRNTLWSSGKVLSSQSVHVTYAGKAPEAGVKYYWRVRVWDNKGNLSAWSETATWEMGLLHPADWKAAWITQGFEEDEVMRPSPMFRTAFSSGKKIESARLYITANGLYEAFINGRRVGDSYLTPGWTSYNKRLQYQVYDVTGMINRGNNGLGVMLGSGWYRGNLAWGGNKNIYGTQLSLLCQLLIMYADGSTQLVLSDGNWKSSTGAIRYSEIYHGEINDAGKEKKGWSAAAYNDADWSPVKLVSVPKDILLATYNEPIRKHERFTPVRIFKTPRGELVADFGQNLVGMVEVKVSGSAGDSVKLYHAEVLDKYGNFYTDNLRAAKQLNIYVLSGNGEEHFEPHFTFQGFRYVKVENFPGELKPENLTAVALYSDMQTTGSFSSSNALLNQLQHNIEWGQKGNFLDVPTDCPQRDERLGWTGDAQVFSRTAAFNMRVNNFFAKWLQDMQADQRDNGVVPFVIPNVLGANNPGSAGWSDASTIIPWDMYLVYADTLLLQRQYNSMKGWVDYMNNAGRNYLWNTGFHFGDWLFYRPDDDNSGRAAVTDKFLIAQCFFAHSTQLLINTAQVLGKAADVQQYTALLKNIKEAFLKEYVTANGRLVSSTQTAYVLALNFDMLPESLRKQAAERLVQNIKDYGNHLTTGFLGTPYLCHVLTRFGYTDIAYTLLMQETYPSWLYPVKMGATTIWERWDGQKPDSTFQTPGMNSFNHYAYGAIGDWMYRVMAGIDTYASHPGYKKIMIKPHIGGNLTEVAAGLLTYYGKVSSGWKVSDNQLALDVEIPANTTAMIYLPASDANAVQESNKALSSANGLKVVGKEGDYVVVEAGSGSYHFVVTK